MGTVRDGVERWGTAGYGIVTVGVRYGDANGLNSLEILYVRSHEIWDLGIHQNNKKHREPAPSMAHQVNFPFSLYW